VPRPFLQALRRLAFATTVSGTECERDKGPYDIFIMVEAAAADLVPTEKVVALVERAVSRLPAQ
jgi:hypothetical protein